MSIDFSNIKPQVLAKNDNLKGFFCDKKPIDDFIQSEAIDFQNERLGISYVFRYNSEVVAFLTLSMADIKKDKMHPIDKIKIGKENYPALQISQLAVRKDLWGNDVGTFLCDFSLAIAYRLSEQVGCRFLVLNSKPEAIGFYQKYGFILLPNQKRRDEPVMFLNIFNKLHMTCG
jgi:hypothetical protein